MKNKEQLPFYLCVLILTFSADILHIILPRLDLSARIQTYISALAMLSTVIGLGFGIIENHPDYDIILQLSGGIFGGALGYYIINALRKPKTKN
ncbi:MAG: hypothetical protein IIW20_01110, partial [Clostridia bacterium]|nr:hypothetical protein [Clostridia bacterium]